MNQGLLTRAAILGVAAASFGPCREPRVNDRERPARRAQNSPFS